MQIYAFANELYSDGSIHSCIHIKSHSLNRFYSALITVSVANEDDSDDACIDAASLHGCSEACSTHWVWLYNASCGCHFLNSLTLIPPK